MLLMTAMLTGADDAPPNPVDKPGFTLVFQDEFDGSELDLTKWIPYYLPHWTDSANLENARADYVIEDGKLKLRLARGRAPWSRHDGSCTVSSIQTFNAPGWHRFNGRADVTSHGAVDIGGTMVDIDRFNGFSHKYGYWEMRAKMYHLPRSNGHQAWWTAGVQGDDTDEDGRGTNENSEFDLIETQFQDGHRLWGRRLFNWDDPLDVSHSGTSRNLTNVGPNRPNHLGDEFHIYAAHWTPYGVEWYFDNTYLNTGYVSPRYPHGMLIGMYTRCWNRPESQGNVWPRVLEVDYVRVWDADEGYVEQPIDETWTRIRNRCSGNYARWMNQDNRFVPAQVQTTPNVSTDCPSFECHRTQWRIVRPPDGAHAMVVNHHLNGAEWRSVQGAMQVGEAGNVRIGWSRLNDTSTHWLIVPVPGTDYVRFASVSDPDLVMYEDEEDRRIKYSASLQADDIRSHWELETVPWRKPCRFRCR